MILSPCLRAYGTRSGTRAMVPSSFMISQMTPAGLRPARRARSTAASVWPARSSTPPGRAMSGNTWPGCTRSPGRDSGSMATWMVCARSAAEMPVVTPGSSARLDRDGEGGLQARLVVARHRRQVELAAALRRQREADEAAAFLGHEVDVLGGGELGGHREVALVLAVLVVADDDHACPRAGRRAPPRWSRTARAAPPAPPRGRLVVVVHRHQNPASASFSQVSPPPGLRPATNA